MKRLVMALAACFLACPLLQGSGGAAAAPAAPQVTRPPIVGVANIGLYTSDLAAAKNFFGHVLGFADAFSVDKPGGGLMLTYFKVDDHQYIEIYPGLKGPDADRLDHIGFETTDARRLRAYLASKDVNVPGELKPGPDGSLVLTVKDPDGHNVQFVQYLPGSLESRNFGKFLPPTRVARRIIHFGVTVGDRARADHFYRDILGFKLMWQGGMTDTRTDWVDMRVPEGKDWLEYMLNVHNPSPKELGVMHHFSLGVKSIQPVYREVLARGYKPPHPPQIGRDGKWQLNLYDPDFTRAEVMEFKPVRRPCCSPMHSLY
jgi:catechol 2,3-dioxygenase-like lactoylglutathione lyase family enzyme